MIRKFPMKQDLLTTQELSKYINITPTGWAVRRSTKNGPPFIKIKDEVRYLWQDVLKWMMIESSHKAFKNKRNESLYKRFEEIKTEMPSYSNKRIAHIIAHEFNLSVGTSALYICNYVKKKKEENSIGEATSFPSMDSKINIDDLYSRPFNHKSERFDKSIHFKYICERYDEIKIKNPYVPSSAAARIIAPEIGLSYSYTYTNLRKYINTNKDKNQDILRPKLRVGTELSQVENPISKKSSLSHLSDAILTILKSKNSINNRNL